jgi:hypothetical protein
MDKHPLDAVQVNRLILDSPFESAEKALESNVSIALRMVKHVPGVASTIVDGIVKEIRRDIPEFEFISPDKVNIKKPVVFIVGSRDSIVDPDGVTRMFHKSTSTNKFLFVHECWKSKEAKKGEVCKEWDRESGGSSHACPPVRRNTCGHNSLRPSSITNKLADFVKSV